MKWLLLLLLPVVSAQAAIINAESLSRDHVNTAVQSALAGDTVVLPAGTIDWTSGISWTAPANVTLMGAGTSATGGGDLTVILDGYASSSPLLAITGSGTFRMTGITFESGTAWEGPSKDNGTITFSGMSNLRIDHCHFDLWSNRNSKIIVIYPATYGVMDHCVLDLTSNNALYIFNGRGTQGNSEWNLPTNFGGSDYFFIEDNIINGLTESGSRIFDAWTAAKVTVRFNTVVNACLSDNHATGHAGDDRGFRSQEVYGNLVTNTLSTPARSAVAIESGTALVWGNDWSDSGQGSYRGSLYLFHHTRQNTATYSQSATPSGWGYSGTQYLPLGGITTGSDWDGGTVNETDLVYGYPCLDQPGRGQGDLLSGSFPNKVNTAEGNTIHWPNQALEPVYIWKNGSGGLVSGWGGTVVSNDTASRIVANRDYYLPASGVQTTASSPFNGTVNVGWGTLANRPTTCTTGVAYFATDQGDTWSTLNSYGVAHNGKSGVLYKCTATDTWTLYYTPYAYPHPLQGVVIPPVSLMGARHSGGMRRR